MKTKFFYHYTSMCNAVSILISKELRLSKLDRLNDINERVRITFGGKNFGEDVKTELEKYAQLSLTMDGKRPGYAIPALWGHYGDKGEGACLVFSKNVILDNIPDDAHSGIIHYMGEYYGDMSSSIICDDNVAENFFKNNIGNIFFYKTKDWEYEQEFRIVRRIEDEGCQQTISLKNALIGVIIFQPKGTPKDGAVFNSSEYKILKTICIDHPILELGKIINEKPSLRDEEGNPWEFRNGELRKKQSPDNINIDC